MPHRAPRGNDSTSNIHGRSSMDKAELKRALDGG